ncbi:hypothetical protein PYW08_013631 [Mythimna loreyi]|uniref:Uncharacterized protein n=1 Tax=Mythimna loreyi TaxID=667449 RepID=A0ACC2QG88_9NEOP|nr:hypothetical protein PYW08_013631 [Mythimna loreyi]
MSRTYQVLVWITLLVKLVHSFNWDIVIEARNKLVFYNNGAVSHVEDFGADLYIKDFTHDVLHNRLLLSDRKKTRDHIIYSFNIATKEILPLVKRRFDLGYLQMTCSLVYDPVTEILFWSDIQAIYWFSLKSGFVNNAYGTTLFVFDDSTPNTLAVDSCKGYIYWSNMNVRGSSSIEMARFDGAERKLVIDGNMRTVYNLVIDQNTQRMYWTDDVFERKRGGISHFFVRSADLNGENKRILYIDTEKNQPRALTVSKDSLYWVPSFDLTNNIWQLPKNPTKGKDTTPSAIKVSGWLSNNIVANYNIEDQIQGIQDCESLRNLLPKQK